MPLRLKTSFDEILASQESKETKMISKRFFQTSAKKIAFAFDIDGRFT